jgi:hypothetical protein
MRTKSILLSAAVLAAGVASSMAANVYSINVVGYVTLNLTNGFNLINNPLDAVSGGAGTNNTLANVFATVGELPDTTTAYQFNGVSYNSDVYIAGLGGWLGGGTIGFNPGQGIFLQLPSPASVTFVGSVVQGPTTNAIPSGFSIVGSQPPVAGLMQTTLNYQPTSGDTLYYFDPVSQSYPISYVYAGVWFGPGGPGDEPSLAVGQAIFLQAAGANSWVNNYTVQ